MGVYLLADTETQAFIHATLVFDLIHTGEMVSELGARSVQLRRWIVEFCAFACK